MALKTILESLDGIEENLHALYAEKDGKFVLQVEGIDDHPAVIALKNGHTNSKRERDEARRDLAEAKKKLEALPDGFDPDEYARLKADEEARLADPEGKDVRAKVEAATKAVKDQEEAKRERMKREHEAVIAEKDATIEGLNGEIRRRVVTDGLRSALTEAGVKSGLIPGAIAMFDRDVEVLEEDGRFVARMKSDLGGDEVSKFISNWAQGDAAKEWIAPPTGGDAGGSQRTPGDMSSNPYGKAGWSKTAQSKLVRENRAKAEQLAKAAGFKTLEATFSATGPIAA